MPDSDTVNLDEVFGDGRGHLDFDDQMSEEQGNENAGPKEVELEGDYQTEGMNYDSLDGKNTPEQRVDRTHENYLEKQFGVNNENGFENDGSSDEGGEVTDMHPSYGSEGLDFNSLDVIGTDQTARSPEELYD